MKKTPLGRFIPVATEEVAAHNLPPSGFPFPSSHFKDLSERAEWIIGCLLASMKEPQDSRVKKRPERINVNPVTLATILTTVSVLSLTTSPCGITMARFIL